MDKLYKIYAYLFAKPFFYKWNYYLYRLALSGLGILNFGNSRVSGEQYFIETVLANYVSDKPIFFDVGANIGNYSKNLANRFPNATLHVFEPHPRNFKLLKEKNPLSDIVYNNKALSNKKGSIELYDYEENDGSSHASIYKEVIEDIHHSKSVSHKVETDTIDNYLNVNDIEKIDLLKIDVEGHEYEVLQGATKAIHNSKIGLIHFEFNEMNVESGIFLKDIFNLLKKYNFYRMLPHALLPIDNYRAITHEIFAYQNIIAIRKDLSQ